MLVNKDLTVGLAKTLDAPTVNLALWASSTGACNGVGITGRLVLVPASTMQYCAMLMVVV